MVITSAHWQHISRISLRQIFRNISNVSFSHKDILFQDKHIVAVNKRIGICTQGEEGSLAAVKIIVDSEELRLDKDTSGVLLLARTDDAMSQISALFANREIDKKYLAVTLGLPNPFKGKLVCKLEKKQVGGKWKFTMADASGRGVEAITKYRVISFNGLHAALVELMPITGRQHQLRVQCHEQLHTSILGDPVYGPGCTPAVFAKLRDSMSSIPMHLHAREISLPGYPSFTAADRQSRALVIAAPLPPHFLTTLKQLHLKAK